MEASAEPINNMGERPKYDKNIVIGVLIFLLSLSFLGINLLGAAGGFVESINNAFGPLFRQILSLFGYTAGAVINKTSDVVTDTSKVGIELAGGAVHDVGDLLINASKQDGNPPSLDIKINQATANVAEPTPDKTDNPIQNAPANRKCRC